MSGTAAQGARAPEFDLPLLGAGRVRLRDIVDRGGGVLVFFKSDCPTSALVVPELAGLAHALAAERRAFVAIAQDSDEAAIAFRDGRRLDVPVAVEAAPYEVSRAYGIEFVPTVVVVDGAGRLAGRLEGFVKSEYIASSTAIARALSLGAPPPVLDHPEALPAVRPG
jgi:peroxiredoxin